MRNAAQKILAAVHNLFVACCCCLALFLCRAYVSSISVVLHVVFLSYYNLGVQWMDLIWNVQKRGLI